MGEVGGTGGRGDRASDNEGQPDNGGRGVGGRASGGGGRPKREKWVRERRKRTTARERDASKMQEGREGRADLKVVGATPACRGTAGRAGRAEGRTFPAPVARSFLRPRPVWELRLGIRGWEGSAHFAGTNPLLASPAPGGVRRRAHSGGLKPRGGPEGMERALCHPVWPQPSLRVQSAGTQEAGKVPAARSRGSRLARRPAGGAERRGLCHLPLRASLRLRAAPPLGPPIKLSRPSSAPAVLTGPAPRRVGIPHAPQPSPPPAFGGRRWARNRTEALRRRGFRLRRGLRILLSI